MIDRVERALAAHPRFEERDSGFVPSETIFDAIVRVDDGVVRVENEVPTLDAAVENETVAPVVEDGWFETFERRVADVDGVTNADRVEVTAVDSADETITVVTELAPSPGTAGEDAVAVVSYVEGTWMQGVIPGYDYVDRVQRVRDRARQNARSE
ncbi:DUF5813 family protein [Halanaeroarchaeum sulfurireducens]|uniref:Uncharacterized protein n=1 Tax=Halanaeroarchaeum sulfurireducens TaxID=1604004 RepID=A0A0F7PGI5_9EURY|nr:DUF5813 family protein [Halanaeroarchaeum sulfurireducens]AKH98413.1 hypothetical protein HLASF_1944 [Halanaeroarchaeum sulfurireducens]ALG82807.1 hypothetical protein HLASA_1930 [Halanaeroarchaeum sulfurireducens]